MERRHVGVGFPGPIRKGLVETAVNLSSQWVGKNPEKIFTKATRQPFVVINDADAAGLAELHYGAGKKEKGSCGDDHIRHGNRKRACSIKGF